MLVDRRVVAAARGGTGSAQGKRRQRGRKLRPLSKNGKFVSLENNLALTWAGEVTNCKEKIKMSNTRQVVDLNLPLQLLLRLEGFKIQE